MEKPFGIMMESRSRTTISMFSDNRTGGGTPIIRPRAEIWQNRSREAQEMSVTTGYDRTHPGYVNSYDNKTDVQQLFLRDTVDTWYSLRQSPTSKGRGVPVGDKVRQQAGKRKTYLNSEVMRVMEGSVYV